MALHLVVFGALTNLKDKQVGTHTKLKVLLQRDKRFTCSTIFIYFC